MPETTDRECEVCLYGQEDCGSCDGTGDDGYDPWGCPACGGTGEVVPEHCCGCGGSPYCVRCHACGAECVGECRCPVEVVLQDGTVRALPPAAAVAADAGTEAGK